MLPGLLQEALYYYHRPSQDIDKEPTLDYIAVAFAGIACVALQEGRTPPRFMPALLDTAQRAHDPNDGPTCPLTTTDENECISPAPTTKDLQ